MPDSKLDKILRDAPAKRTIDFINLSTPDEAKRCRLLLAALLLRTEKK